MPTFLRRLLVIFVTALAYFCIGKLSLLLAIPPGYSAPVWPASGIAFVMVLLYGPSAALGVFLGSTLMNLSVGYNAAHPDTFSLALSVGACIGAGAGLQALMGLMLVRISGCWPSNLVRFSRITSFMLLSGPVACLVNSVLGVTTLVVFGKVAPGDFFEQWWSWWIGDSIGVMLVAPMLLPFLAEPHEVWRNRIVSVALPAAIILCITTYVFKWVSDSETALIREKLEDSFIGVTDQVDEGFSHHAGILTGLDSFYHASEYVSHDEFSLYCKQYYNQLNPLGIQSIEWAPVVRSEDMDAFLALARKERLPEFKLTERSESGDLVPVAAREKYIPVLYAEPRKGNESAIGYDLNSEAVRRETLASALTSGQLTLTPRLSIVQDKGPRLAYLAIYPHFKGDPQSAMERMQAVRGYLVMVFYPDTWLLNTLRSAPVPPGCEVHVYDDLHGELLYENMPQSDDDKYVSTHRVRIGDRSWQFEFRCALQAVPGSLRSEWIMIGGLLFASLCSLLMMTATGTLHASRELVALRTKSLNETTQFLDNIIENIPHTIFVKDAESLRYLRFNRAGGELLGIPSESMIGKNDYDLFPREQADAFTAKDREVLDSRAPSVIEREKVSTRDKGVRTVATIKIPILSATGEPVQLLGIAEDITEKLRLEEISSRSETLNAVGLLAGGIAHNLNNGLQVIRNSLELIVLRAEKVPADTKQRIDQLSETAQDTIDSASGLIRNLLEFAKGKIGEPVAFDAHNTLLKSSVMLRGFLPTSIEHELSLQAEHSQLLGDPHSLETSILNLAVNARDAMSGAGKLSIATWNEEEYLVISVRDTGKGIPEEVRKQLFTPFFTTKGKFGTGLGLASTYGIVKAFSGDIAVQSVVDEYTEFQMKLPVYFDSDSTDKGQP